VSAQQLPAAETVTWVFAYGSLLWNPGFPWRERHVALLDGYRRAFVRYSFHHRGTPERPGLVCGLREGGRCVGMAYPLDPETLPRTLDYLDKREGAGYLRRSLPLRLGADGVGPCIQAWVYVPNPAHPSYFGEQDRQRLVELVATGRGASGTALDYLRRLIAHLGELGVREPELAEVFAEAQHHRPRKPSGPDAPIL
jgi:cation transport protein ChaC